MNYACERERERKGNKKRKRDGRTVRQTNIGKMEHGRGGGGATIKY